MQTFANEKPIDDPSLASPVKTILIAWLTAGTLDLSTALIVWSVILKKITATQIFQGIASGFFGKEAFTAGNNMIIAGFLFHYFIAFLFTLFYFLICGYISFLKKFPVISGILYGIFVWACMAFLVLPLSHVNHLPFKWSSALISCSILIVCIGLPVSLIIQNYYRRRVVNPTAIIS